MKEFGHVTDCKIGYPVLLPKSFALTGCGLHNSSCAKVIVVQSQLAHFGAWEYSFLSVFCFSAWYMNSSTISSTSVNSGQQLNSIWFFWSLAYSTFGIWRSTWMMPIIEIKGIFFIFAKCGHFIACHEHMKPVVLI